MKNENEKMMWEEFCKRREASKELIDKGGSITKQKLKRRYVYIETFDKIMAWAKEKRIRAPYRKSSFPFFLQEYLKENLKDEVELKK